MVGLVEGRYGDAGRRRKGMAELGDDPVDEGAEGWEIGANTREARRPFPDGDIDVGEAGLAEDDALDVVSSGPGLLEDDSLGCYTGGQKERSERDLVSSVGPADACDSGEPLVAFLEALRAVSEDPGPGGDDAMTVDGAELANVWLRLRTTLALGPGRARLVGKWSPADRAVGVCEGVGVCVCEVGPFRG